MRSDRAEKRLASQGTGTIDQNRREAEKNVHGDQGEEEKKRVTRVGRRRGGRDGKREGGNRGLKGWSRRSKVRGTAAGKKKLEAEPGEIRD